MPPRISAARFLGVWILAMVSLSLVWTLVQRSTFAVTPRPVAAMFTVLVPFLFAVLAGGIQSFILARCGRPLPRWMAATSIGALAGLLLNLGMTKQGFGASWAGFAWLYPAAWGSTSALCLATAQGFAIWGFRWNTLWPLWLSGILCIRVLPALGLNMGLRSMSQQGLTDDMKSWSILLSLLQSAVVAAGTSWLLDRLAFRQDPDTA